MSEHSPETARVASYYDEMQRFYTALWHESGVHYGYWDDDSRSHDDAVRHLDRLVGRTLDLTPGSRVLDAGCGVGGTSVHLAEHFGLNLTGITLSREQMWRARARADGRTLTHTPDFQIASYLATPFERESFDGVFGIESICYALTKRDFLREAWRLLRPGGRIVVLDGFDASENRLTRRGVQIFCDGFAVPALATVEGFADDLDATGFVDTRVVDLRDQILPSARRIERLGWVGLGLVASAAALRPVPKIWWQHCLAGVVQRQLFARGAMRYALITAVKAMEAP